MGYCILGGGFVLKMGRKARGDLLSLAEVWKIEKIVSEINRPLSQRSLL
jgi:hypothetical protein